MRSRGGILLVLVLTVAGCHGGPNRARMDMRQNTEQARRDNEQAYDLIQKGKYTDAEKLLHKALDEDVMLGPAHNNLGLIYYQQNKLYEAAWEFQHASKLMPHSPEPRNNLGLVFEKAGRMTDAAESYGQARQIEPDNPEFIANMARAKVRGGADDDETRRLLEEVVMKDSRPEWTNWARMNLIRLNQLPSQQMGATTQPVR